MRERKRRQLQEKRVRKNRRTVIMLIALVCILALGLVYGSIIVKASRSQVTAYKYYTEVEVDLGDTLWDIANEYMTEEYDSMTEYINEVRRINSLCGDEIYYGDNLMVPYYSSEFK